MYKGREGYFIAWYFEFSQKDGELYTEHSIQIRHGRKVLYNQPITDNNAVYSNERKTVRADTGVEYNLSALDIAAGEIISRLQPLFGEFINADTVDSATSTRRIKAIGEAISAQLLYRGNIRRRTATGFRRLLDEVAEQIKTAWAAEKESNGVGYKHEAAETYIACTTATVAQKRGEELAEDKTLLTVQEDDENNRIHVFGREETGTILAASTSLSSLAQCVDMARKAGKKINGVELITDPRSITAEMKISPRMFLEELGVVNATTSKSMYDKKRREILERLKEAAKHIVGTERDLANGGISQRCAPLFILDIEHGKRVGVEETWTFYGINTHIINIPGTRTRYAKNQPETYWNQASPKIHQWIFSHYQLGTAEKAYKVALAIALHTARPGNYDIRVKLAAFVNPDPRHAQQTRTMHAAIIEGLHAGGIEMTAPDSEGFITLHRAKTATEITRLQCQ